MKKFRCWISSVWTLNFRINSFLILRINSAKFLIITYNLIFLFYILTFCFCCIYISLIVYGWVELLIMYWIAAHRLCFIVWIILMRWLNVIHQSYWILIICLLQAARYHCSERLLTLFRLILSLYVYLVYISYIFIIWHLLNFQWVFVSIDILINCRIKFLLLVSLVKRTLEFLISPMVLWTTYSDCRADFLFICALVNIIEFIIMVFCHTDLSRFFFQKSLRTCFCFSQVCFKNWFLSLLEQLGIF